MDSANEKALNVIRGICNGTSLLAAVFVIILYLLMSSLQITSHKVFFFLGIAEILKAISGFLFFIQTKECSLIGVFEVYCQSCCLASLLVMAWFIHFDAIDFTEKYLSRKLKFVPLFSFGLFPLLMSLL
jgi:hypothetical protein